MSRDRGSLRPAPEPAHLAVGGDGAGRARGRVRGRLGTPPGQGHGETRVRALRVRSDPAGPGVASRGWGAVVRRGGCGRSETEPLTGGRDQGGALSGGACPAGLGD